jgi:hypothetical protein
MEIALCSLTNYLGDKAMKQIFKLTAVAVAIISFISCEKSIRTLNDTISSLAQKEVWGDNDAPDLFDKDLEYTFSKLPLKGESKKIPWTGTYWPNYEDSINIRWDGENSLSATEKYEKAFGGYRIEDMVSNMNGIGYIGGYSTACTKETEEQVCSKELGEVCAIRRGEVQGKCIPTWFGLCHAWAPAAILEKEPVRPVVHNGVEFKVNDIKALVTFSYNQGVEVNFLSGRCNDNNDSGGVLKDEYGRPSMSQCRDTNPGTFHVIATNYLGIRGESFVEDRTMDDQVWNQPVRKYEVEESEEISLAKANVLLGIFGEQKYGHDYELTVEKDVQKYVGGHFVAKGHTLKIEMTGDGDGDLYVSTNRSNIYEDYVCRPYKTGSEETCTITSETDTIYYIGSVGFAKLSNLNVKLSRFAPSPNEYRFNTDAKRFQRIKMVFSYISESDTSLDGNLSNEIDKYTESDVYDYILELDIDGKILGGEWIGDSIVNHPDFLWLPTVKHDREVAGIKWLEVQELLRKSTEPLVIIPQAN